MKKLCFFVVVVLCMNNNYYFEIHQCDKYLPFVSAWGYPGLYLPFVSAWGYPGYIDPSSAHGVIPCYIDPSSAHEVPGYFMGFVLLILLVFVLPLFVLCLVRPMLAVALDCPSQ